MTLHLGVISILFVLFAWHLVIADSRSRVTTYLRASGHSRWEELYRRFSDKPPSSGPLSALRMWGQRNAAVFIFVVLGLCVPLLVFRAELSACVPSRNCVLLPGWFELYCLGELAYLGFVIGFGIFRRHGEKLEAYKRHWRYLIRQDLREWHDCH